MSQIDNKLIDRNTLGSREEQDEASKELKRQEKQREFLNTGAIPGAEDKKAQTIEKKEEQDSLSNIRKKRWVSKSRLGRHRKEAPFGLRIAIGVKEVTDFITIGFFSPLTNFIMAIYIGITFLIGDEELKYFLKKRIFLPMILEFFPIISAMPWYVIFVFGIKPRSD